MARSWSLRRLDACRATLVSTASATIQTDWNTELSGQQRWTIFAHVARRGYYAAGPPVAFPGIGELRAEGDGYARVPASYIFGK